MPDRPQEGQQANQPQADRDWDQKAKEGHFARRSRSAFSVTTMDEPDIANAAISGVTSPISATGMATAL